MVNQYESDYYVKYYDTWRHFLTLLYTQVKEKDSLRDIIISLNTHQESWYHVGIEDVRRSTISDANARIDYRVYEGLFYALVSRCKDITPKHKFRFKNPLYSIDATVIDLCLSMFPWAKFRRTKGALKLHCQYDHSGAIPSFLVVTDAKHHDVTVVKKEKFPFVADSIISVDRAYIDYEWLNSLDKARVYFVTRAKSNMKYEVIGQHEADRKKGILFDKEIMLTGFYQKKKYPKKLRLIGYKDPETGKILIFLTNNFTLVAYTITQIYKSRWQIELFFKWIKQNLKIKSFLGTSKNAVMNQIWTAMCYYLLLAYIKYQTKYANSMLELSRILKESIFSRISIIDMLSLNSYTIHRIRKLEHQSQLALF
jgi:hypothetical protein